MQNDDQNNQNLTQNSGLPTQQQQPVATPVSTPVKEVEPYSFDQSKIPEGYIEVSEKEPQIRPEVESAGVYKVSDKIKLSQEARNAGLTEAKESTPAFTTPTGKIKLPMNEVEATMQAKGNPQDSSTWLGKLVLYILQKIGVGNA